VTLSIQTPWTVLLSKRFRNVHEEYGPNSQVVASALEALDETRWFERVGEPWLEPVGDTLNDNGVMVVRSWEEALAIFSRDRPYNERPYNVNGILKAACSRVDPIFEELPEREDWWQKAREEAKRYTVLSGWAPKFLAQERRNLLFEHLWEYVSMLLAEIIASPEAECTYFREQLPWFHAGHFPCGWDGDWPNGHMRVY
jgi:hypothetical protein